LDSGSEGGHEGLIFAWCALENQIEGPVNVDALVELLLQSRFCFAQNPTLSGLLPREIGENCELILQIGCGDAIPKTIFERENFSLFLFKTEDRRVRQMDGDFLRAQVNGDVLLQIETSFGRECPVQLDALCAPGPRVEQFVFDFDLSRENRELSRGRHFLQVDAVVNGDARLQVRDFRKRIAEVAANPFKFRRALFCGARGPALQAKKNDREHRGADQNDQGQRQRPGEFSLRFKRWRVHEACAAKKYRPPRPIDVKGGCSPQNIFETVDQ
jgi:hypothetical protein